MHSEKEKKLTRSKTLVAKKRGIINNESCVICGEKKTDAHHVDYNNPYDLVWLCRSHHSKLHKKSLTKDELSLVNKNIRHYEIEPITVDSFGDNIPRRALMTVGKLVVEVIVKDYKFAYGNHRWLVTPTLGMGKVWTENIFNLKKGSDKL